MADEALLALFHRKMNRCSADNPDSVKEMTDFYTLNERKLISICKRHMDDKHYKRLKDFVTFEYSLRYNPPTDDETKPEPPKMALVAEGTNPETHGNPDGVLTRVDATEENESTE